MAAHLNEQRWFREVLALVGREVELGLVSSGAPLSGRVVNTMFDSFILELQGKPRVIRFEDLSYLLPRSAKTG